MHLNLLCNLQYTLLIRVYQSAKANLRKTISIPLLATALIFLLTMSVGAQERTLNIVQSESYDPVKINIPNNVRDSISITGYLLALRFELIEDGFLAASIDSVSWKAAEVYAYLDLGNRYNWAKLSKGNVREEILIRVGYREKFYTETLFKPKEVSRLFESLLDYAENNGYPFASVGLDSIELHDGEISATLKMKMNNYTVIDSLIVKGGLLTNPKVLENHLGISKGDPYDQSRLSKIPNRLKELPFVQVIKPYEVGMREGKSDVYLYLDNRKASNFDGILGILPDAVTGDVVVTGDVQIDLMNALKRAETINMRWQRLQTRTQQLDLRFMYPFVFNSPFGAEFKLNLFRQDTLFSQVNIMAAIPYFFKGGDHIKIYVEDMQANVISPQAFQQRNLADSRTTVFGLGVVTYALDYRFNPRSGYAIEASAGVGTKRINPNPNLDPSFYDDVNLNSELYNMNVLARYFQPVGKRSTVMFRLRGGYFINDNMFLNEAYRIGGLKSIRGFDEQGIFATGFAIATLEYRFIFEENSNLFVFLDQGAYENRINNELVTDTPLGFGGGINFETPAGIFSLTYALGRQFDNNIELRSGKIHFGFVNFF